MSVVDLFVPEDINYKIIIPIYADLMIAENCLNSIEDWSKLIIVDNSKESFCKRHEGKGAEIHYHPENIGVARSWNIGLKKDADWTFVCSCCMKFEKGFSNVIKKLQEGDWSRQEYLFRTMHHYHLIGINKKLVEKIGYFDENFYPAYYEDVDHYRRVNLSGLIQPEAVDTGAICQETASAVSAGLSCDYVNLAKYYVEKWGGEPDHETYNRPFKDKPLDYWDDRSIEFLKDKYGLRAISRAME